MRLKAAGRDGGSTDLEFGKSLEPTDLTIVTYPMYKAALLASHRGLASAVGLRLRLSYRLYFSCQARRSRPV